jgi:cytochrome b
MSALQSYRVWDLGTRCFHWLNFLCVTGLMGVGLVILNADALEVTNPGKVMLKSLHVWIGYVFALNLLWRFVWAFLGNRHARLGALLPGGKGYARELGAYIKALRSGQRRAYLGHNPLGRIAVALLMLLLLVQAVTGLVLAGTDLFMPPIGGWIAEWIAAPGVDPATLLPYSPDMYDAAAYQEMRAFRAPFVEVHEISFFILLLLVAVHIAAVIITEVREGGSLISAMFTGNKIHDTKPVDP